MGLTRVCGCTTVYCVHNPRIISTIPFWIKLRLLFVKRRVVWDHSEQMISVFKSYGGVTYILEQEPIQYGDARNAQISRY